MEQTMIFACPHYDEIVNFPFSKEDYITDMFISDYQEVIFAQEEVELATRYDTILYQYLTNADFYRYVQKKYQEESNFQSDVLQYLQDTLEQFKQEGRTETSKWL